VLDRPSLPLSWSLDVSTINEIGTLIAPSWLRHSTRPLRWFLKLTPEEASFRKRKFISADRTRQLALETTGKTFIGGYNAALAADHPEEISRHIHAVTPELRGFTVEGAAMGCAIADALPFRSLAFVRHVRMFEREYSYLTHVGAGWALARVPWRQAHILAPLDPVHYWLVFDGVGFHDAYFHHRRVLAGWRRRSPCTYAARVHDQGIGRALWFVAGGSVAGAIGLISSFAAARQSDLWSGLGLAMAYAGPTDGNDISAALAAAGAHRDHLAQGVAFACEARAQARHIPAHTELTAKVVSGVSVDELSNLVRRARAGLSGGDADTPPYELWRRKVVAAMASMRGS
jgi:hypothetical protein